MIAVDTNVLIYACDQADPRRQRTYAPGLISAVVPLCAVGIARDDRALDQVAPTQVARGLAVGLVVHAVVFIVTFTATQGVN